MLLGQVSDTKIVEKTFGGFPAEINPRFWKGQKHLNKKKVPYAEYKGKAVINRILEIIHSLNQESRLNV